MASVTDFARWADPKSFRAEWEPRAQRAASLVSRGSTVLDLGCGAMAVRRFLPPDCRYVGCDLYPRDADTIICDFNKGQFPKAALRDADYVTMLGLLEYIADVQALLRRLRRSKATVIVSYHPTDVPTKRSRAKWVSALSEHDLAERFRAIGYRRRERIELPEGEILYRFARPWFWRLTKRYR